MIEANTVPFEVLLVEDEPADANLVRMALKENKVYCRLHHVLDGVEALSFLRREGEAYLDKPLPDLILLDINMPRMNGRELLRLLKADEAFSSIPVVMLTTSDVDRDIAESYRLGASGYITKPVDIEQFILAIKQVENYWFTLARLPRKE